MSNEYLKRGWPVFDRLIAAALRELVTVDGAHPATGTVLKENQQFPAITVERVPGGGRNADNYEDTAKLVVRCWGTNREQSDEMTTDVRDVMNDLSDEDYAGVGLDRIREETGPGRVYDPNPKLLAVPTTWFVKARWQ